MKVYSNIYLENEGLPARLVDGSCEAGNKKSADLDVYCNILITY